MLADIFCDEGLSEKEIKVNVDLVKNEMAAHEQRKDCYAYVFKSGPDKHIRISYTKKAEIDKVMKHTGLSVIRILENNADHLYNRFPAKTTVIDMNNSSSKAQQNAELYE